MFYDYDDKYKYDIVFIGGIGKLHSNRIEILESLAKKYENFAFFGYGVENIPDNYELRKKYKGWADTKMMRKLFSSSKIALNLTLDNYEKVAKGFNSRLFEISACGGAIQVAPNDNKINEFFLTNDEVFVFNSANELFNQIEYLLQLEGAMQRDIAERCLAKSTNYSYKKRAKKMLSHVYDYKQK